jgi:sugar phosphate isomerase/epimerase
MKLGFLTACLPRLSLDDIAVWASKWGFEALEVAAWPELGDRPFTATHLNAETLTPADAERVRDLFDTQGLMLFSIAYYDNRAR